MKCAQVIFRGDLRVSSQLSRVSRCRLTYAFALIRDSNGPAQQTGRSPQVARAGVDDAVVPAQVLLR